MGKYMFTQVKQEPERVAFSESLPTTPMKKLDAFATEYDPIIDMNLASHASMGTLTPSNSFGLNTISPETAMGPGPYMMTPSHSLSGSEVADTSSSWSIHNESPITFLSQKDMSFPHMESQEMHRYSQSPVGRYHLQSNVSPNRLRAQRKMMLQEAQRKTSELQRAQIRASRKRVIKDEDTAPVDVVRRAMCKCDYPGCHKAFRRNEHLKRHKQT
jgi:hypothetical protein